MIFKITGWVIFGLLLLVSIIDIADDDKSAGARLLSTLIHISFTAWVFVALTR